MSELKELHHHHRSILGFNHISEWTLQQLLLYYAKMYLLTYDPNDPDAKNVSKIFNYLKDNNKKFTSKTIFNYKGFVDIVYTDESKKVVKDEIKITILDIDVVVNVLRLVEPFPVSNTNKFACSNSKSCNNCSDKSNCRMFGFIKKAIDALLKVRHLAAHQAEEVWIELEKGTFKNSDFQNPTSFHQLWDIYTDHLKTVVFFLNDNGQITKTQSDDRNWELVKYGKIEDSSLSDNNIMKQFIYYVIAHKENQLIYKLINISFDVKIPGDQLPSRVFALDGELMDHVILFGKESIKTLSGIEDVKIKRRRCIKEQERANLASVRVKIAITHQLPLILQDYTDIETAKSKTFKEEFFAQIKEFLHKKYRVNVDIFPIEWEPGN